MPTPHSGTCIILFNPHDDYMTGKKKKLSMERLLPTLNHTASKWWGQELNVHPEFLFLRSQLPGC